MTRVFVDTTVLAYALGREHSYREPCRAIVAMAGEGRLAAETGVEVIQELLHVRARRSAGVREAIERADEYVTLFGTKVHSFEPRDLSRALDLLRAHRELDPRDAVHAATALNRGIAKILSADRHFDHVPGLERVDPAEKQAVDALAGEPRDQLL